MEKIAQALGPHGLQIPLALMQRYGLETGTQVTLKLLPEGIYIVPYQVSAASIENRALRYLLTYVGDAVTVEVQPLPANTGWQVNVYGAGMDVPAGALRYSAGGILDEQHSTPPQELRGAVMAKMLWIPDSPDTQGDNQ